VERIAAGRDPGEPGGVVALTGWPDGAVADLANLGGAFIQELAEVYGFAAEAAEKRHKHDAIELFNGDLIDGRVKVLKGSQLEVQMLDLQWVIDDAGRLSEPKGPRNDCCDAAIYVRRHAQHKYAGDPPAPRPAKGTPEADELEARESIRRLQERESARRRGDPFAGVFDDDFTTFFGDVR
jgi:hypothetical protein